MMDLETRLGPATLRVWGLIAITRRSMPLISMIPVLVHEIDTSLGLLTGT